LAQFSFLPSGESSELTEDIRELFQELAASLEHEHRAYSGECHPTLDVLETSAAIEVVMDVCGITPAALRVLFRGGVLIIAGEKAPTPTSEDQTFHLVEREFGRFARAVKLTGAFNIDRATASVHDGELTIVLPKLADRRGQAHRIPVSDRRASAGEGPG
jgi:HSP20 family protein